MINYIYIKNTNYITNLTKQPIHSAVCRQNILIYDLNILCYIS